MNIQNDLAIVTKLLMFEAPFYGHFLLGLNKLETRNIPTAGVSKNGVHTQLSINPDYWNSLSNNHKIGLLEHELKHICFLHLMMRDSFSDKTLFNIAADAQLHETHKPEYIHENWITVKSLNEQYKLNLASHESTKYYYDQLQQEQQKNPNGKFAQDMKNGTFGELHITWEEFDKLSEAEKKLIQKQIEYQIKELINSDQKMRGHVPGELKSFVDSLFEVKEPVIDWKGYFRRFIGSSQEVYTKKTRRKYNKRYDENPGLKIKSKKKVLVGVDMSGSMSETDIKEAFHEIYHVYKSGVMVDVMEVDTRVHNVYPYKGKWSGQISGRGGTEMSKGIQYFNDHARNYTTLVMITDGYIESPDSITKPIQGKRVLWVVSSNGQLNEEWPGFKIQIKK